MLGKDVVRKVVIFAVCRASLPRISQNFKLLYPQTSPLNLEYCFSAHKTILVGGIICTLQQPTWLPFCLWARPILTPTDVMFTSVILPRPLSWALFLSQQEPISEMKPYVLCKEFQCKHVLSMLDSQSYVVIWKDFSKHVLCLNTAKIYELMSHSKKSWPSTRLKWISLLPHLKCFPCLQGPPDIITRRTWLTKKSRMVTGKVEARPVSWLMLGDSSLTLFTTWLHF